MIDIYLRFDTEAEATAVLYDDETARYRNIDTIGVIYKPTGEMLTTENGEVPEMAPIPGWHVNIRLMDGEDAEPIMGYAVTPTNPIRVWA